MLPKAPRGFAAGLPGYIHTRNAFQSFLPASPLTRGGGITPTFQRLPAGVSDSPGKNLKHRCLGLSPERPISLAGGGAQTLVCFRAPVCL